MLNNIVDNIEQCTVQYTVLYCESNSTILFNTQNRDYNRSLTPVGTIDVSVSTAAIFLASKPEPAQ